MRYMSFLYFLHANIMFFLTLIVSFQSHRRGFLMRQCRNVLRARRPSRSSDVDITAGTAARCVSLQRNCNIVTKPIRRSRDVVLSFADLLRQVLAEQCASASVWNQQTGARLQQVLHVPRDAVWSSHRSVNVGITGHRRRQLTRLSPASFVVLYVCILALNPAAF